MDPTRTEGDEPEHQHPGALPPEPAPGPVHDHTHVRETTTVVRTNHSMLIAAFVAALALLAGGIVALVTSQSEDPAGARATLSTPTDLPGSAPERLAYTTTDPDEPEVLAFEGDVIAANAGTGEPADGVLTAIADVADGKGSSPRWAPGGEALAHEVVDGSARRVVVTATPFTPAQAGGPPVAGASALLLEADGRCPTIAPDASRVAFQGSSSDSGPILVASLPRGTPAEIGRGRCPVWSPAAARIAFVGESGRTIVLSDPAGISPTVARVPSDELSQLTWSPDGSRLAFVYGASSIGVYNPDADAWFRVARSSSDIEGIAWRPDGEVLAYGSASKIFATDPRAEDETLGVLADVRGRDERLPTWSPDGTRIAFESEGDDGTWIAVMDVGGQPLRVAQGRFPAYPPIALGVDAVRDGSSARASGARMSFTGAFSDTVDVPLGADTPALQPEIHVRWAGGLAGPGASFQIDITEPFTGTRTVEGQDIDLSMTAPDSSAVQVSDGDCTLTINVLTADRLEGAFSCTNLRTSDQRTFSVSGSFTATATTPTATPSS